jgi:hypothetical protein
MEILFFKCNRGFASRAITLQIDFENYGPTTCDVTYDVFDSIFIFYFQITLIFWIPNKNAGHL